MILSVILCGCETWSLTLTEERRVRVSENMVLRRTFGPTRDEVTGKWRKLHNEELNDLYSSPNIILVKKIEKKEMGGACSMYGGEKRRIQGFRVLVGEPEGKDHSEDLDVDGRIILPWICR